MSLQDVLSSYRSGHSLPRDVYHDPDIYEQEIRDQRE